MTTTRDRARTRSLPQAGEMAGWARSGVGWFFERTSPPRRQRTVMVPPVATRARAGRRLRWLLVVLSSLFALVVYKLTDLQVLNPTAYTSFGEQQRVRSETLAADRGTISDRNGTPLALSSPQRSVFVDPKLVVDASAEAARLAEALGLGPDAVAGIEEKMTAPNRFGYIARQVDDEVAARVDALKQAVGRDGLPEDLLPGVAMVVEPKRFRPSGNLAQSILGQVDIDGVGLGGLEQLYAEQLTGTPGKLVIEQSPNGKTISAAEQHLVPAVKGDDLQLTLDRSMQFEAERILGDQVRDAGAKGGVAIVMKPATGEILAMANMVNDPVTGAAVPDGNNAAMTTAYEPGSVMKMITAAGAVENGLVEPDTELSIPDALSICDATFTEHDYHGTVSWPLAKVISQSSNTGTIKLGQMLGKEEIYRYMRGFGIGERTPIGFPNEQSGSLMPPEKWWCSSQGTIPIGQGVSVTPLQMLTAYNAIANNGIYVAPRLVDATIDAQGNRHPTTNGGSRRVVSEATADKMNLMLRGVVLEGTGKKAAIEGYTVAGKTGTARKPQPGGGYGGENGIAYMATFVGFVPAEAPTLSVIVIIDEPTREGIFGGVVAAPAFAKIAETALRQFAVPPPVTDGPAGGIPVAPADHDARPRTAADSGVQYTADGRVRAPAAVVTTLPPITVPPSTSVPGATGTNGAVPATYPSTTTTVWRPAPTTTTTARRK